jgi:hypothetical protein
MRVAGVAALILLPSALPLTWSIISRWKALTTPLAAIGSFVAGLPMSLVIALVYSAAAFIGVIF